MARLLIPLAAGVAIAMAGAGQAQDLAPDDTNLAIHGAIEIHYKDAPRQVFELQGSNDLARWRDIGDVVFGGGGGVREFLSSQDVPMGYQFYRVRISPSEEFGFAPTTLTAKTIVFNDDGAPRVITFDTGVVGRRGTGPIIYSYRKSGDKLGRFVIGSGGTESEQTELYFCADLVGIYERTRLRGGVVKDIDRGTFALAPDGFSCPDPPVTSPPRSLVGLSCLFSNGPSHERLDFVSASGGRAIDGAAVEGFSYNYEPDGETGVARVVYTGGVSVEFEMAFAGQSCGTYERREYFDGGLESKDDGVFSIGASVYHGPGAISTDTTLPAVGLAGRSYLMRDGGTPCQLLFDTPDSGKCIEGDHVDGFKFDYAVSGKATSVVKIKFGAANYDEYHLNHADCTFMRLEVRAGVVADTDTGTFSETP